MNLVDTNMLVYAYDRTDEWKRARALAVLDRLQAHRTGALSVQVMGEFFVTVTRKIANPLTPAEAQQNLRDLARFMPVYDLTPAVFHEAICGVERYQLPYWDALIWATAKLNGVTTILTEDFSTNSTLDGVRITNPLIYAYDLAFLERGR